MSKLHAQDADCCTIVSGVVTAPDNDACCAIQPSTYGITLYDKYLCTAEITAPTTSSNADLSNCVRTFQSPAGSVVRITESTSDQAHFQMVHSLDHHLEYIRME